MRSIIKLLLYRKKLITPHIEMWLRVLNNISIFVSALLLVTIIFEYGFIVSNDEYEVIGILYDIVWGVFIINSLSHIIFSFKNTVRQYGRLAWAITILLYLTLIPVFIAEPQIGNLYKLWRFLDGGLYHSIVLSILAFLNLSDWVVKLIGKRINPSLIFSISFIVIILFGAGLLMLPRATYDGISFIDALFTSTSATCVTGLTTVDVTSVFTPIGFAIIMVLIQIGGLGVMTVTSFFALFFMGNTSLCNQSLISEMVSSRSLNSLLSTLLHILGFTAIIEIVGAAAIFVNIHSTLGMTLNEEIAFSIFHSISAFCNAGFSTMPNNLGNEMLMSGHNLFYITISILIILGGIGFPILVNLHEWSNYSIKRIYKHITRRSYTIDRKVHIYGINTKIAVLMISILIIVGTVSIGVLEWNGAFSHLPIWDRCVQTLFTAVSPRTAGFSSVNLESFTVQSIMLMLFLMVIGGGSQSTAGGIKVNTFAVILLNIKSIIRGNERVTIFNRTLSMDSVRRSNSTLVLYILFIFIAVFMLSLFEPDVPLLSLLFESISALSTVGASINLTPYLGVDSKLVLIALMFIGRIGVFTIIVSIIKQHNNNVEYTSGNIIIN